jgi:hypothetical protein
MNIWTLDELRANRTAWLRIARTWRQIGNRGSMRLALLDAWHWHRRVLEAKRQLHTLHFSHFTDEGIATYE